MTSYVDTEDVTERDQTWFEGLFNEHAVAVHRYFLRRAHASDAEDLAAEVLATAWRRRDTIVDGHELAWLYRTAGFVLANARRKNQAMPVEWTENLAGAWLQTEADTAGSVAGTQDALDALNKLSARDREILMLVAWDGVTGDELAEALGVSRGGADAALSRARARLRAIWQDG